MEDIMYIKTLIEEIKSLTVKVYKLEKENIRLKDKLAELESEIVEFGVEDLDSLINVNNIEKSLLQEYIKEEPKSQLDKK